jgi:integrase
MKAALELASKKNRNGLYEIYVRIQQCDTKKRIKAGIAVKKTQFKSKNHNMKWVINHPNHIKINSDLRELIDRYEDEISTAYIQKEFITPESLIMGSNNAVGISTSIITYCTNRIKLMDNYNQAKGFQQMLNKWIGFTTEKKLGDLHFKQVNPSVLKEYENWLRKTGIQDSTNYTNLKNLRALFNYAMKEDILDIRDYPFGGKYKMPTVSKSKKEKLTIDELKRFINDTKYQDGTNIQHSKMSFILSYNLAGIRVEDLLKLKWSMIKGERLEYRMTKTGSLSNIQITPQLLKVINYFKKYGGTYYLLPFLQEGIEKESNEIYKREVGRKTALINKYLKMIAKDAEIDKNITNHIARHTWASIAIKASGGNINFVKNKLQHKDASITEGYLADLDTESMDDIMAKVTKV